MKNNFWVPLIVVVVCAVLSAVLWPFAFTVVPIEAVEAQAISETFDPAAYVDGMWESQIKPGITEQAVDMAVILNAMQPDAAGAATKDDLIGVAEQYGLITGGEAHVYRVRINGTVTRVDMSKSIGVMEVQPNGYSGPIKVQVYLGPRIPSDETSVRDAVGFISFGDFKEQTEFGKVSTEINKRINTELLGPLDKNSLTGKPVVIYGAFTIRTFNLVTIDLAQVNVVPVMIDVQ